MTTWIAVVVFCCSAIAEICTASVIESSLVLVNDNFSQSQPFTILPNMVILSDWSSCTHQISVSLHMLCFSLAVGKKRSGYKTREAKNCYFLAVCVCGGGGYIWWLLCQGSHWKSTTKWYGSGCGIVGVVTWIV